MLPYVDATTYIEAPTGIDTSTLVPTGVAGQESAALVNILERASSVVDFHCYQRIAATLDNEQKRVRPNREGHLEIFPKNFPVINVLSARYIDLAALASSSWKPITVASILPLERSFLVYDIDYTYWRGWGTNPLVVQYQYQNGYPHTTLTGPVVGTSTVVAAGAATITVASTIGIAALSGGAANWNTVSELEILDGATREIVTVTAVNGNTLTLAAPTVNAHSAGALVTAVPPVVQEATILIATWAIKNPRGDAGFVMSGNGFDGKTTPNLVATDLLDAAREMLTPFRRVL